MAKSWKCVHGLPGWCANCAGVPKRETPEFRRRMPEPERISFGRADESMRKAVFAEGSDCEVKFRPIKSQWRKDLETRVRHEAMRKLGYIILD